MTQRFRPLPVLVALVAAASTIGCDRREPRRLEQPWGIRASEPVDFPPRPRLLAPGETPPPDVTIVWPEPTPPPDQRVQPVDPATFVPLFPPVPKGWFAEEASATTGQGDGGWRIASATRTYVAPRAGQPQGTDDDASLPSVQVDIIDGADSPFVDTQREELAAPAADSGRTARRVQLEGRDAIEVVVGGSRHAEIAVSAGNRFLVRVRGANVTIDELRQWARRIDFARIERAG